MPEHTDGPSKDDLAEAVAELSVATMRLSSAVLALSAIIRTTVSGAPPNVGALLTHADSLAEKAFEGADRGFRKVQPTDE